MNITIKTYWQTESSEMSYEIRTKQKIEALLLITYK